MNEQSKWAMELGRDIIHDWYESLRTYEKPSPWDIGRIIDAAIIARDKRLAEFLAARDNEPVRSFVIFQRHLAEFREQ